MVAIMIDNGNPREFRYSELGYNPALIDFLGKELAAMDSGTLESDT